MLDRRLFLLGSAATVLVSAACHGQSAPAQGPTRVAGLSAPIEIIDDRWGVPHIYAASQDDANRLLSSLGL